VDSVQSTRTISARQYAKTELLQTNTTEIPMSCEIEPTITLPEAVAAILFALEFPEHLENFYDIAFLLQQRPSAVRSIIKRMSVPIGHRSL
jgi:hypothetical protein